MSSETFCGCSLAFKPGPEVIKLEYSVSLKCKIKLRLAACGHVSASSQSLRFILSLRWKSSFKTLRPVLGLVGLRFCGFMSGSTQKLKVSLFVCLIL